MGTYAIGDIHGCFRALTTLAEFVPLQSGDRLIALGDYVDRGPHSREVIDWLIDRHASEQLAAALQGNHDRMMLAARRHPGEIDMWLACGGYEVLDSYGLDLDSLDLEKIPGPHWDFLENTCVPWFETETHLYVHAGVEPDLPIAEQSESTLFWERLQDRGPHVSGKQVICGHTSQPTGWPVDLRHTVCIDTRVYSRHGWLTCLHVETGDFWQANEAGETRESHLSEVSGR